MLLYQSVFIFIIGLRITSSAFNDFPALQTIFSFFGAPIEQGNATAYKDILSMTLEELGLSRGHCAYYFLDYVSYRDRQQCTHDDQYIGHLMRLRSNTEVARKPPIMVKCVQTELPPNATIIDNNLLMMNSIKDIVSLLKPIGNGTKRHEPGSCVLVLFYTETSLGCAHVAPYANMLPFIFPTLRVAAIDAFHFTGFNTEFGIVGLPTLLLFHQGRPIVKFYSDVRTFAAFVTRHTGILPVKRVPTWEQISGPLPLHPVQQSDYVLVLAWGFILLCLGKYFAKSRLCKHIVEVTKRSWRESGAQLEHAQ